MPQLFFHLARTLQKLQESSRPAEAGGKRSKRENERGLAGAGDTLAMREFHGVLSFAGPVPSLSLTTRPNEYWHAFTFGMAATTVPEPGTLALLGLGLAGLGLRRRK